MRAVIDTSRGGADQGDGCVMRGPELRLGGAVDVGQAALPEVGVGIDVDGGKVPSVEPGNVVLVGAFVAGGVAFGLIGKPEVDVGGGGSWTLSP
jgi:hypothetical protein